MPIAQVTDLIFTILTLLDGCLTMLHCSVGIHNMNVLIPAHTRRACSIGNANAQAGEACGGRSMKLKRNIL